MNDYPSYQSVNLSSKLPDRFTTTTSTGLNIKLFPLLIVKVMIITMLIVLKDKINLDLITFYYRKITLEIKSTWHYQIYANFSNPGMNDKRKYNTIISPNNHCLSIENIFFILLVRSIKSLDEANNRMLSVIKQQKTCFIN